MRSDVHSDALKSRMAEESTPDPATGQLILDAADRLRLKVAGPRMFDPHIAVRALDHRATEVWPRDPCLIALPGLRLVDPLAG